MVVLKPGDKIGEYILEERIGRGTFGEVWRAHHALLRKKPPVAVKIPTDPDLLRFFGQAAQGGGDGRAVNPEFLGNVAGSGVS